MRDTLFPNRTRTWHVLHQLSERVRDRELHPLALPQLSPTPNCRPHSGDLLTAVALQGGTPTGQEWGPGPGRETQAAGMAAGGAGAWQGQRTAVALSMR